MTQEMSLNLFFQIVFRRLILLRGPRIMEDVFRDLEKQGKADVDNLIKWMQDSKLIEATREQEQKARNMFKDVADIHHIELQKFKDVVEKLAIEQKKSFEMLSQQLAAEGPRIVNAAMAGIEAFKKALEGK